jgi:hypothetical protein
VEYFIFIWEILEHVSGIRVPIFVVSIGLVPLEDGQFGLKEFGLFFKICGLCYHLICHAR